MTLVKPPGANRLITPSPLWCSIAQHLPLGEKSLNSVLLIAGKAERLTYEDAAHNSLLQEECPAHLLLLCQGRVQAWRRVPIPA